MKSASTGVTGTSAAEISKVAVSVSSKSDSTGVDGESFSMLIGIMGAKSSKSASFGIEGASLSVNACGAILNSIPSENIAKAFESLLLFPAKSIPEFSANRAIIV